MTTPLKCVQAVHLAASFVPDQLLTNAFSARQVNSSTKVLVALHVLLVLSNISLKEYAPQLVQVVLSSQMH